MRLGLLVCDHVRPELVGVSGDYEDMFRRLFASHREVEIVPYEAIDGEIPSGPEECDAWITTGSRHSVYEDMQWIRDLEGFVREVKAAGVPFVGICFGHQLIASALGGSVSKADSGWGVGSRQVAVADKLGWGEHRILTSHQDQVALLPPGAEVLGWSDHCAVAVMGVGETVLGIQGHPEFDPDYSRALMEMRRGTVIDEETVDQGLASLDQDLTDQGRFADWIFEFVEQSVATR